MSKWIWTVDYQKHRTLYIVWENSIWNLSHSEPPFQDVGLTLPLISFRSYRSRQVSHVRLILYSEKPLGEAETDCELWNPVQRQIWETFSFPRTHYKYFKLLQIQLFALLKTSNSKYRLQTVWRLTFPLNYSPLNI